MYETHFIYLLTCEGKNGSSLLANIKMKASSEGSAAAAGVRAQASWETEEVFMSYVASPCRIEIPGVPLENKAMGWKIR